VPVLRLKLEAIQIERLLKGTGSGTADSGESQRGTYLYEVRVLISRLQAVDTHVRYIFLCWLSEVDRVKQTD
jgi:hypothetical protein